MVAATYRLATTPSTDDGPAIVTSSGPRNAKPTANDACSVRLKMPIAVWSWARGTTRGIIDPSAGVSITVVRLIPRFSASRAGTFAPASASPTVMIERAMFGPISAQRRSSRSTTTPANGDRMIWGNTNEATSAPTAVFDRVVSKTSTVSA